MQCCQKAHAQPVTYTQFNFNTTTAGTYTFTSGSPPKYTIAGSGTGFAAGGDSMSFVSTPAYGNIEIEGEVVSQSATASAAQAGLMIRSANDGNETSYAVAVTPGSGCNFYYHEYGTTGSISGPPTVTAPVYMRLTRSGTTISAYYSTTGLGNWNLIGSHTTADALPTLFYSGFMANSTSLTTLNSVVFKFVSYMTAVPQPTANLLQWLRSDVGVTSAAGSVSAWQDQSGNSNNATQSIGALQPALSNGAINHALLPAVTFSTSQYMSVGPGFANLTSGADIFVVLEAGSATATSVPVAYGNAANSDAIFPEQVAKNAQLNVYNSTTASSVVTTSNPLSTTAYQLLEESFQPGASPSTGVGTVYVNGAQKIQSTTLVQAMNNITRSANTLGAGIGPANYFQGGIAEVLFYSAPLTASQRAAVESYILSKYAIGAEPTLDPPTFTPASGIFTSTSVSLSQDQGAPVFYTNNGTTPTSASSWFLGTAIPVNQPTTFNAIGIAPFFNNSSVASATYQFSPVAGVIPNNGLMLWLKADTGVTLTSNKVSSWSDQSGSGNTATQTVAANRPTVVASAINGLPAVKFASATSQFLKLPAGMANFSSGASIFAIVSPTTFPTAARILDFGNGSASDNLLIQEPSSNAAALYTYNGSSPTSVTGSSALTANQYQLLEAVDGSGTATLYTNAVQQAQNTSMNSLNNITRANNFIGQASAGGSYFNGEIAEILVYNRAVTASEKASIEGYLLSRYQQLALTTVVPPILSAATSTFSAPAQVALAAPAGETVYFTTDGTTPSNASNLYTQPIWVSYTQTVKAIAYIGTVKSTVASATYTLNANAYPAPSATDTTPLNINLQLPSVAIPQDSAQH
jgi:hypothetical protein